MSRTKGKSTMKTKTSITNKELHDLYDKHEYREISDENCVVYCKGCGSWGVRIDATTGLRCEPGMKPLPLSLKHFAPVGPLNLGAIMRLLNIDDMRSLARYMTGLGYAEAKKYLKE